MGKNYEHLAASRDARWDIQQKYGFIPTSIMEADKHDRALDIDAVRNSYEKTSERRGNKGVFGISGRSVREGALSRFPQNIGKYLVRMYTKEGDMVLDPFAGHNSRMSLVYKLGRSYIGYDCCHEFMQSNRAVKEMLEDNNKQSYLPLQTSIELHEKDSRNIGTHDADMVLTSPPYWDIEYYGDEKEQLGKCRTYAEFVDNLFLLLL